MCYFLFLLKLKQTNRRWVEANKISAPEQCLQTHPWYFQNSINMRSSFTSTDPKVIKQLTTEKVFLVHPCLFWQEAVKVCHLVHLLTWDSGSFKIRAPLRHTTDVFAGGINRWCQLGLNDCKKKKLVGVSGLWRKRTFITFRVKCSLVKTLNVSYYFICYIHSIFQASHFEVSSTGKRHCDNVCMVNILCDMCWKNLRRSPLIFSPLDILAST